MGNHIQQTKVIQVGTDPTWPPYQIRDNATNEIVGFEVDLANACAAKLGLTIQWNDVAFDNIILSVQNGQLDMGVSGFSVTPDRLDQVSFTLPHSTTEGQVVMLKSTMEAKDITTVNSLADLKTLGITVGVQSGNIEQTRTSRCRRTNEIMERLSITLPRHGQRKPSVQAVYAETPITTIWIAQFQSQGIPVGVIYQHPYYPVAFVTAKGSHTLLTKWTALLHNSSTMEQLTN